MTALPSYTKLHGNKQAPRRERPRGHPSSPGMVQIVCKFDDALFDCIETYAAARDEPFAVALRRLARVGLKYVGANDPIEDQRGENE